MPPYLEDVSITFNTQGHAKDASTVVRVFVKNRASTSQIPEGASDFISNWIALQGYRSMGDIDDGNPPRKQQQTATPPQRDRHNPEVGRMFTPVRHPRLIPILTRRGRRVGGGANWGSWP
jgi:hypothetical protein